MHSTVIDAAAQTPQVSSQPERLKARPTASREAVHKFNNTEVFPLLRSKGKEHHRVEVANCIESLGMSVKHLMRFFCEDPRKSAMRVS